MVLEVKLHSLGNSNASQKKFAESVVKRLKSVVNDKKFLDKVGSSQYSRRRRRTDTGGYDDNTTNETIVKIISNGKERRKKQDQEIDLIVKLGKLDDGTLGSWNSGTPLSFTTNTKFFNEMMKKNQPLSVAAHWMHEWMHVAGFRHPKNVSRQIKRTDVTYTVSKIIVEIGRRIAKDEGIASDADISGMGSDYLEWAEQANCPVDKDDLSDNLVTDDDSNAIS